MTVKDGWKKQPFYTHTEAWLQIYVSESVRTWTVSAHYHSISHTLTHSHCFRLQFVFAFVWRWYINPAILSLSFSLWLTPFQLWFTYIQYVLIFCPHCVCVWWLFQYLHEFFWCSLQLISWFSLWTEMISRRRVHVFSDGQQIGSKSLMMRRFFLTVWAAIARQQLIF